MLQYAASRQVDPASYNGRGGMGSKPHPQQYPFSAHPGYQNESRSHSHSVKQPISGSRVASTDMVNSKIIASKQFTTSLTDQSASEGVVDTLPAKPEHVVVGGGTGGVAPPGGDLGVRECPSGASSPSGTPNNTLVKGSKVTSHHHDPLMASASASQLETGHTARGRVYPPPQDGLETQSETSLTSYSYSNPVGVAHGRGKPPPKSSQHHKMSPAGVKGSIRDWENRSGRDHVDAGSGVRVLHPPVSTAGKDRGRGPGGEQGVAPPTTNGYEEAGGKSALLLDKLHNYCISEGLEEAP